MLTNWRRNSDKNDETNELRPDVLPYAALNNCNTRVCILGATSVKSGRLLASKRAKQRQTKKGLS